MNPQTAMLVVGAFLLLIGISLQIIKDHESAVACYLMGWLLLALAGYVSFAKALSQVLE